MNRIGLTHNANKDGTACNVLVFSRVKNYTCDTRKPGLTNSDGNVDIVFTKIFVTRSYKYNLQNITIKIAFFGSCNVNQYN